MGSKWSAIIAVVLGLVSLALGWWANDAIRLGLLVGHTPVSWAAAVLPGPAAVQGSVQSADTQLLTGPFSSQPCVYFRKLVEREEKDSDGDTHWKTIEDSSQHVPFQVRDPSGSLSVQPDGAEFRAPQVHRHQNGDMRYTEYAIRPGSEVFVFGDSDGTRLRAATQVPFLVSALGEEEYRHGKGFQSVLMCTLAVAAASFFVYFLCMAMRWHHIFVHLSLLTTVLPLWLFTQWFVLAKSQFEFADTALAAAEAHIATTDPDSIPAALLKEVYNDGVTRLSEYRAKLPNRVLAWGLGLRQFTPLELTSAEQAWTEKYPLRARPDVALSPFVGWLFGLSGLIALVVMGILGFRRLKVKRLIENLPTTPAAGAVYGAIELSGYARPGTGWLASRYTQKPCVWYKFETKERRGSGKNARWVVIESGEEGTPFGLEDDSGTIQVHPLGAKVTGRRSLRQREGRRIKTEWLVDQTDALYILGAAKLVHPEDDALSVAEETDTPYIISVESEGAVQLSFGRRGFRYSNGALIGGTVAILTLLAMRGFSPFDFFLAGLFPPLYLVTISVFFMYNDLIFLRNRMHRALSMIDVALKKRADLVPQLVDVTKAYLQHEKATHSALAAMRSSPGESVANIERTLEVQTTGVTRWRAVVEQYPDLKGNQVVQQLQHRLAGLENEIAFCRQSYNDTLERYNSRIQTLPEVVLAKACGFQPADFLNFGPDVQIVPSAQ